MPMLGNEPFSLSIRPISVPFEGAALVLVAPVILSALSLGLIKGHQPAGTKGHAQGLPIAAKVALRRLLSMPAAPQA